MENPLTIQSWPRAILHVDADAFFASCEQAINPDLKGRPVVTGRERGIVAAASYEAKERGIKRGMRIFEVKKICPEAVILPSDYETYSLFSLRLFEILRRYSPDVEEYSIDEAFVDLTGLRRPNHCSYEAIAMDIQKTIKKDLDISVSIGLSITKVLAKIASRYRKPCGFTSIPGREIHLYLDKILIEDIWGIGPNTAALLRKSGITTALEFARKGESFVKRYLSKPYREIWCELNGKSIFTVNREKKETYQSISKAKTFTPPTNEPDFLIAQLTKNMENACIKARRHRLLAKGIILFLRTQDFKDSGVEIRLTHPSAHPSELFEFLIKGFKEIYNPSHLYRQTGVILTGLIPSENVQYSLFDDMRKIEKMERIYNIVDRLSERFGKHTVFLSPALLTKLQRQHEGNRGVLPSRRSNLFKGENERQRIGLPLLQIKV